MKSLKIVLLFGLVICVLAGCSDKKKEEAAKLEQELQQMDQTADTSAGATAQPATPAPETPAADVAAVPQEEETAMSAMPSAPSGDGFTVQVASCENRDYASHLVDVYFGRGYEPFVSTFNEDGQTYYRVRIGNLNSYAEAKALKLELADRYSINPWIDRLNR